MSSVPMPLAEAPRVDQARWATIRLVLGSPSGMVGVALFVFLLRSRRGRRAPRTL